MGPAKPGQEGDSARNLKHVRTIRVRRSGHGFHQASVAVRPEGHDHAMAGCSDEALRPFDQAAEEAEMEGQEDEENDEEDEPDGEKD